MLFKAKIEEPTFFTFDQTSIHLGLRGLKVRVSFRMFLTLFANFDKILQNRIKEIQLPTIKTFQNIKSVCQNP